METANWIERIDFLRKLIYLIIIITISILVFIFILAHWSSISVFWHRILAKSNEISVGGFIDIKLGDVTRTNEDAPNNWIVHWRANKGIKIIYVDFSENINQKGQEFIEMRARTNIDMSNGFIGNGRRLLKIECPRSIWLEKGQSIKLYTGYIEKPECKSNNDGSPISARVSCTDECGGLFLDPFKRGKVAFEGDRIVLISEKGEFLLDLDYWWARHDF